MLRLGLTGNLGSGKSTVASLFATHGAHVLASDDLARDLMQPGQAVFQQILTHFGPQVLTPAGTLNRQTLARLAFTEGRVENLEALNAIVHPAVLARQAEFAATLQARDPQAVLLVESALILQTKAPAGRFDQILLVTAPEQQKIARFVHRLNPDPTEQERAALEAEARRRLALQLPDEQAASRADHVIQNVGSLDHLRTTVDHLWPIIVQAAAIIQPA